MSDGAEAVGLDVRELDIESIESNAWNPNKMGEDAFNRLVKEIEDVGFLDPVQVVELDTGKFRLLGGEHRLEAMRTLGRASVPAVVLKGEKWKDEDLQKMVTVRLNVLKGNLDPGRMALLYDEMAAKYGDDALQDLFAYTDKGAFDKMLAGIQRGLKSAGLPKQAQKKFNAATKEIKSVEDLSMILNDMFSKYGDTVEQDFMVFTYGKKDHVYV
ncbi:MAG: ParB/RepB/Spo0J family partition protein, partial [Anderseniella sp.]